MKNRNASMAFIFITILVDVIGIGIIIPVLPTLITNLTGEGLSAAAEYGGWLMFAFAVMQFFFAPLFGELSDRFGRRPVLLLALLGLGVDYIFHAFAPTIAWLFVGRVLAGICGASFTVATSYIADISTPENKARNFGFIGAAFGLGFIVGPLIGGFCARWGVEVPFLVAAALTLLNLVYGFFVLPESLPPEKRRPFEWKRANPIGSLRHLTKYPIVKGLVIPLFLVYIAGHAVQSTWTYFTMYKFEWDEAMVSYSLAVVGLLAAVVQGGLIGVTVKKFGEIKTVIYGFIFWSIGLVLFSLAQTDWMIYAFLIPYVLGGVAGPTLQSIMSNEVPDNEQGELQGGLTSMMSVTTIIGPVVMTMLFAYATSDAAPFKFAGAPFLVGALMVIVGLFIALKALKMYKAKQEEGQKAADSETDLSA